MFRVESAIHPQKYCDGISRRSFIQLGVAGMASVSLANVLRASKNNDPNAKPKKETSVILIWLDGGPGHMDMYDMKPQAPAEYRGIWRPIKTNVPGIEISELFPRQAKIADKFSIIRSLHHDDGDHFGGAHRMLTGRAGATGANQSQKYPGIGAIAARLCGSRQSGMPAHAAVPYASTVGLRPGYMGASYVGRAYDPFETNGNPNADNFTIQNLALPGDMSINRLEDRRGLCRQFDRLRRQSDASGMMDTMDKFDQDAYDLVVSPKARKAFDIGGEDPAVREMYGRNEWGQSCLLARRLVEAGSTFVTVHFGGWDHHWDLQAGMENYLPKVDLAVSGLFNDLVRTGLYDKTLVVLCGEFSRTPRMNDGGNGGAPMSKGTPGRDHWGNSMFTLMGGGGVKGGVIVGSTDRLGEKPAERPLTPGDIHHTIYHVLGIDPKTAFLDFSGRPTVAVEDGDVISELV